jgi:uncharacterized protein YjiS (DUF1127 family)
MLHRTMRRRPSQNRVQPGLSEGTCNDPFAMNIADDAPLIAAGPQPIVATARAWLARLQARLGRLDASWRVRRQRSRKVQELAAFSDRELWDLGLGRSDLQAIANGTYRRD